MSRNAALIKVGCAQEVGRFGAGGAGESDFVRAGALDRVLHRDLGLSLAGLTQAWRQQLQRELG